MIRRAAETRPFFSGVYCNGRHSLAPEMTESCEVCSVDEQLVRATVFCVDCSQRLCERCSWPHTKMKTEVHDVRPLSKKPLPAVDKDVQKLKISGKLQFVF